MLSSVSADERKQFCLRPFALGLVRYAGSGAGGRFLVGECVLQGYDGTSGQDGKPVEPEAADGVLEVTAQVQRAADAERLTVAIAVVITERDVLLVCRRDAEPGGITWQFPAGIVKPGASGAMIAVRETLSETDIHCSVRQNLGSRIHPVSGVTCEYYLCDYLIGEVQNRDPAENVSVTWAPRADVSRFIPADNIFPPVRRVLEGGK